MPKTYGVAVLLGLGFALAIIAIIGAVISIVMALKPDHPQWVQPSGLLSTSERYALKSYVFRELGLNK